MGAYSSPSLAKFRTALILATTLAWTARAQLMRFYPSVDKLAPILRVPAFGNENEQLFDPTSTKALYRQYYLERKYVFGGYIYRDWKESIDKAEPRYGQYPIFLKHRQCGAGMYSTQFRLDNPPPVDGTEWDGLPGSMPKKSWETNFNNDGKLQTSWYYFRGGKYLLAAPCCPFADKNIKCCRKMDSSGGFGGTMAAGARAATGGGNWQCHPFVDPPIRDPMRKHADWEKRKKECSWCAGPEPPPDPTHTGPRPVYVQPICDNAGDGNRACTLVADDCKRFTYNNAFTQGTLTLMDYLPDANDLNNLGRYRVNRRIPTIGGEVTGIPKRCMDYEVPGKSQKLSQFYKMKKFCTEDNRRMKAFWGPPDDDKILGSNYYRTHDMWWSRQNQCNSCKRFGMMYYSGVAFNSVCTKVGPGEAATPDGTGVMPSAQSRNRYVGVKNPRIANSKDKYCCELGTKACTTECTTHYTSDYRLIIDMTKATLKNPTGTLHVKGTRVVNGKKKLFTANMDIRRDTTGCKFDSPSSDLPWKEVKLATSCTVSDKISNSAIIPVEWPKTCLQASPPGKDTCSVIASVSRVRSGSGGFSDAKPAGNGDARLFARADVKNGNVVTDSAYKPTGEKPTVIYYKDVTYENLYGAMGFELTYELAILVRKASTDMGCGRDDGGTKDIESSMNYFTYYYPHYGNYDLHRWGSLTFVHSYEAMVTEQRKVMLKLRNLEHGNNATAEARAMPVKATYEHVAPCSNDAIFKQHPSICDPNDPTMKYEGLPAQDTSTAQLARGGVATPKWHPKHYFGDFPNYGVKDIEAGWVTKDGPFKSIQDVADRGGSKGTPIPVIQEMIKQGGMRTLRAAASCVPCKAGWEGARQANTLTISDALGNISTFQTGRFLRAGIGPLGKKDVKYLGLRTSIADYHSVCSPCLPGTYNPKQGKRCIKCGPGKFSMALRRSNIPAFYASSAPMRCWECLKGFACPYIDRSNNQVANVDDYGNMIRCEKNYYQDERGKTTCKKCPNDMATAQFASTSMSDCKPGAVPPGYRFRGPYNPSIDIGGPTPVQMEHVPCVPGTFSRYGRLFSSNSITCSICGPGRYSPMKGSPLCYACPLGEYNDLTAQAKCKKCECEECNVKPGPGDNVNVIVNTAKTKCIQAPENMYSVDYDDEEFKKCPCAFPSRPITSIKCGVPSGYTAQQIRELHNACSKGVVYIVKNETNNTQQLKSGSATLEAQEPDPGETDWLTMVSLVVSFPLIMVSMILGTSSGSSSIAKKDD